MYLCPSHRRNTFFRERKPMWILIISLIILVLAASVAGVIHNRQLQKKIERGELNAMPEIKVADTECCGQHEVCERDSLLAAVSKKMNIMTMKNWTGTSVLLQTHTPRNRKTYSVMCSTRCRTPMWPAGYAVCNCVASHCPTT